MSTLPEGPFVRFFREATVDAILAFVAEQRREDLTLEFKVVETFNRDTRKILATAISAFANSSGGLIVWGVDARKDAEGVDAAANCVPLAVPHRFLTDLSTHAASATSPPVDGVEHRLIEGDGGPFALTLVPESDRGPHMAKLGEDRYYKRSGDQSRRMEHFDISDMFGRRRRAHLRLELTKERSGRSIMVAVINEGRGSARAPYLSLRVPPNFRVSPYGFDDRRNVGLTPIGERDGVSHFGATATEMIHPKQTLPVVRIFADELQRDGSASIAHISGPQVFRYDLAAEDTEMISSEIVLEY